MGVLTDLMGLGSGRSSSSSSSGSDGGAEGKTGALGKIADFYKKRKKTSSSSSGPAAQSDIDEYHKGGKVRKTGLARLKKGERVLTAKQDRKRRRGKSR